MEEKRALTMSHAKDYGLMAKADFSPPIGQWTGRLLNKCWGKSVNLICFFEDVATGEEYRLSAFRNAEKRYCPKDNVIDFSQPGIEGKNYLVTTGLNSKGNPAWLTASLVDDL